MRKPVEDVLHHLAGIAVKLNATGNLTKFYNILYMYMLMRRIQFKDIPDAVARLPRPQLVNYIFILSF